MPKNLLQDMVKVKKAAPIPAGGRKEVPDEIKENNNKGFRYRIYFVALVSVTFLFFALSFLFSEAKITLIPKTKEIAVKENLSAVPAGKSPGLSFDLVIISGEENKTMQGGEIKDTADVATGAVILYNSYSSSLQTLNVDTRLEGSNGKIYKTNKKITIPGMTENGKPGSVEVGIYGAEAGAEYNSAPLDFKIFGFKGTLKYAKFYGRSKGEITGGFKGRSPVVSSLDRVTALSELKATLETKLREKVADQIPSGFILFKNAVFLDIDDEGISFVPDKENLISVRIKGALYGFLFDEKKMTKKIAEDTIDKYDGSEIHMPNIRDLVFSLSDKENISFADIKNVNFTLSGTAKVIWKIDENKFIADLLDKKKKDFNQILSKYPNIASAELVLRPFWKTSFPEEFEDIKVIVNYPK